MSHSSLVKPPADPVSLQKRVVLDLHNVENVSSYASRWNMDEIKMQRVQEKYTEETLKSQWLAFPLLTLYCQKGTAFIRTSYVGSSTGIGTCVRSI